MLHNIQYQSNVALVSLTNTVTARCRSTYTAYCVKNLFWHQQSPPPKKTQDHTNNWFVWLQTFILFLLTCTQCVKGCQAPFNFPLHVPQSH